MAQSAKDKTAHILRIVRLVTANLDNGRQNVEPSSAIPKTQAVDLGSRDYTRRDLKNQGREKRE